MSYIFETLFDMEIKICLNRTGISKKKKRKEKLVSQRSFHYAVEFVAVGASVALPATTELPLGATQVPGG